MALRYLLILCVFAATVAAEENSLFFHAGACASCKAYEFAYNMSISATVFGSRTSVEVLKSFCGGLPRDTKDDCLKRGDAYADRVDRTEDMLMHGSLCDVVFDCDKPDILREYAEARSNMIDLDFCNICMSAVGVAEATVDVDSYITEGTGIIESFCEYVPLIEDEICAAYIKSFADQLTMPVPHEVCTFLGMCEDIEMGIREDYRYRSATADHFAV